MASDISELDPDAADLVKSHLLDSVKPPLDVDHLKMLTGAVRFISAQDVNHYLDAMMMTLADSSGNDYNIARAYIRKELLGHSSNLRLPLISGSVSGARITRRMEGTLWQLRSVK